MIKLFRVHNFFDQYFTMTMFIFEKLFVNHQIDANENQKHVDKTHKQMKKCKSKKCSKYVRSFVQNTKIESRTQNEFIISKKKRKNHKRIYKISTFEKINDFKMFCYR